MKDTDYVGTEIYSRFNNSPSLNKKALLERMYIRVLTELCINRFKWVGMPDSVDLRFLEYMLFNRGLVVFYHDNDYARFMALQAAGVGKINMYDNPTKFTVIGNTMINKTLDAKECVPIWANYLRVPDWDIVRVYASQLAEAQRTIEINMISARNPVVLAVDTNERLSLINTFRQLQEGVPVIHGTQSLNPQALQEKMYALNMGVDKDAVLNAQIAKSRIWNECMTMLGIDNANQDKKERMVVAEVGANDGQVLASRAVAMNAREQAAEQINRMYLGLNVSVHWNLDNTATQPEV